MSSPDKPAEIQELDRATSVSRHVWQFFHLQWKYIAELGGETFRHWSNDNAPRLGAALAYYSVFSLAPLLVVMIGVAGLVFGREAAEGRIAGEIEGLVGLPVALAIQKILEAARAPAKGIFATMAGVITVILGASLVVSELRSSLNLIWRVPPHSGSGGFSGKLAVIAWERFLSFVTVLGVGFLLMVSLVINAFVAAAGKHFQSVLPIPVAAIQGITLVAWFILTSVLFALIYKMLPDVEIAWSDVAVGAIVTSALFTIGKFLIALYLGKSSVTSTYGAAGSLVIILLWVYYSAQIFFLGAEFTQVYANKYGSRLRSRLRVRPGQLSIRRSSKPTLKAS